MHVAASDYETLIYISREPAGILMTKQKERVREKLN